MEKTAKPTLEEALKNIDDSERIYLGCKRGSGWLAIEQAADMKNDLTKIDRKFYDQRGTELKSFIDKILSAPKTRRNTYNSLERAQEKAINSRHVANKTTDAIETCVTDHADDPDEMLKELRELLGDLEAAYKDCDSAVNACVRCEKTLDNLNKDIQRANASKDKTLSIMSTWTPFAERYVSEQYRKKTEPHVDPDGTISYGIAILIEGEERGPYWTYSEVENGVDQEDEAE